jgi:tetratricopeptide (TPR) repeat protein
MEKQQVQSDSDAEATNASKRYIFGGPSGEGEYEKLWNKLKHDLGLPAMAFLFFGTILLAFSPENGWQLDIPWGYTLTYRAWLGIPCFVVAGVCLWWNKKKEAYNNRGNAYVHKGEWDKAIAEYTRMLEINPDYAWAYNNRGGAYLCKGEYDKAIEDCTKAIRLKPDFAEFYCNLGEVYLRKGKHDNIAADFDNAIIDFDKALELKPRLAEAYCYRGEAYSGKGDWNKAIADWETALGIDPNNASAKANLDKARKEEHIMQNRDSSRLSKVWDILVDCAQKGNTITNRDISSRVSSTGTWGLFIAADLGNIGRKCNEMGIPCLNALVVNQDGKCGEGIYDGDYTPKCPPQLEQGIIFTYPGIFKMVKNPYSQDE